MTRLRWAIGLSLAVAAALVLLWLASSMPWLSYAEAPAAPPISELFLTRSFGQLQEASVFLERRTPLATVVDTSIFGGLPLGSTPEAAAQFLRIAPSGRAKGEVWFQTPKAELHVWYSPHSGPSAGHWLIYAVPTHCSLDDVITDRALRNQLRSLLPEARSVSVGILGADGSAISIHASRSHVGRVYLMRASAGSA